MHAGVVDAIRAAGGEVYAVTSEPEALASRAQDDWELPFECVGDPHQEIADLARDRGLLDLHVQPVMEFLTRDTSWGVTHPKGFYQPGVLALERGGRVLYRWRSIPNRENAGGAARRPTAEYVWAKVQDALAQDEADAPLDERPDMDTRRTFFPLFVAMLMAHGWFLRPKVFSYQGDGVNPMTRFPHVMTRLVAFIFLWVTAFVIAPKWALVALLLYGLIAIPGVVKVYTTFANEAE